MSGLDAKGTYFPNGLNVPADKLFIAGTAVTPSAADLNAMDGLAAGKFVPGEKFVVNIPFFAAANVTKPFFVAPAACQVLEARESHVTPCDAADTMMITKLESGEAYNAAGADAVLAAAFTLNSTANTPVTKAALTTAAATLAAGDRLCTRFDSGDGTQYADATLTVVLKWV